MRNHFLRAIQKTSAPVTDPNFNQVALLLHGDGTNGTQNNTFLDSSTNNFSITRSGNTTQGTFTPFSLGAGYWSNFFDGSGDSLTAADNAAFDVGANNWTIECWANFSDVSGEKGLVSHFSSSGGNNGYVLRLSTGNSPSGLRLVCATTGTSAVLQAAWTPIVGTWYHIAAVRDSSTLRLYVDGVQIGSTSIAITIGNPATPFAVGTSQTVASSDMNGYISNVRLVNGTCLYTGGTTFTPPTTPLTAITNTSLLTCQSNRFVDNSSNNFAITRNGDVRVTAFSPFAPTSAYSPSVNGGSGYFDGTGDYLSVADNAALRLGTSDFTVECWFNTTNRNLGYGLVSKGASNTGWTLDYSLTNYNFRYVDTSTTLNATSVIVQDNTWYHVAVVRNGTASDNLKMYINGVLAISSTTANTANLNQTESLFIGARRGSPITNLMLGYLSDVRIIKGTALYTSNFTPPTAPLTAITNTSLLLNFTNAGIFDNAANNDLETVGNAQIDTTVKKYGTGSIEFDGTGDWLKAPDNVNLQLGTGNFTIEGWVYLNAIGTARGFVSKGTSTTGWSLGVNALNQVVFNYASSTINSTGLLAMSTWYFVTVVREGTGSNQTKIYINGTNDGTGTVSTDFNQTNIMYVGADRVAGSPMNGYIDDLRITKGIARYTANFTSPTAAFPNQ